MKLSRIKKLSWKLILVYALLIVLIFFADRRPDKWMLWNFWVGVGFLVASSWLRIWASLGSALPAVQTPSPVAGPMVAGTPDHGGRRLVGTWAGLQGTTFVYIILSITTFMSVAEKARSV